jgi:hypothetical protein
VVNLATWELREAMTASSASVPRDVDEMALVGLASLPSLRVIPSLTDQHPCAQSRRPMDMMFQGWSARLFQAEQQWSTMSS